MDTETKALLLESMQVHSVSRQKRFRRLASVAYVGCGMFLSALLVILTAPDRGSYSWLFAVACFVGALAFYLEGGKLSNQASAEAWNAEMFKSIDVKDLDI